MLQIRICGIRIRFVDSDYNSMETNINTNIGTSLETTHTLDFSDRLYRVAIAFIAVLGVAVAVWGFYQFNALPQNYPQQISVTGEGKAYSKPDIALVNLGVHSEAPKSQDAVDQNNTIMNNIIKSAKDLGIDQKDMKTTSYNLSPLYDYAQTGRVFRGYSLDQQLQVKIRNFEKISDVLDKASSLGANTIGDLQFTVDNPETAKAEARAKAIAEAKEKAVSLFAQSGLKMGKLMNVYEGGVGGCGLGGCPPPPYGLGAATMEKASVAPQIQPGQMEVDSNVTLTYQVK